jgi:long-subunit fatty acid transport protein
VRATGSRRRLALAALFAVAVAAAAAGPARAGGLEVGDNGAEAMGRGGAFVAKADSPAAINYNPAGFAKLGGHHVTISADVVSSAVDFQRQSDGVGTAYPTVASSKPWFVAPMHFVLATDLGLSRRLTLAAGVYGPAAATREYRDTAEVGGRVVGAPQRFDLTSTGGLILFPTLAAGYRLADWIDVGVSFQWAVTRISTRTFATVGAACPDSPEDPACDVAMKIDAQNLFAPTGSAGVLLRPAAGLEFGAMVRLPSRADLHGRAQVEFGSGVVRLGTAMTKPLLDPENPAVTISNGYPFMFRLGSRRVWYDGGEERADLELDLTYENWSSVARRTVTIEAESLGKPLAPMEIDWKLRDTVGLRLGGGYRFRLPAGGRLTARGGLFYESASTAVSDTSLQVLGPRRVGLSVGLGVRFGPVTFDLAYAHIFLPQRTVENSTLTAMDFGGGAGPVVGNGTYRARVDAVYLQVTASYGRPRPVPRGVGTEAEAAPPGAAEPEPEETLRRRGGEDLARRTGPDLPPEIADATGLDEEGPPRSAGRARLERPPRGERLHRRGKAKARHRHHRSGRRKITRGRGASPAPV